MARPVPLALRVPTAGLALAAALAAGCMERPRVASFDVPVGQERRSVLVQGEGRARGRPARADVLVQVRGSSSEPEQAWLAGADAALAVRLAVAEAGVLASDVMPEQFAYLRGERGLAGLDPRAPERHAEHRLRVQVTDLERLPAVLAALGALEEAEVLSVLPAVGDPGMLLDLAREQAVLDARRRAGILATELEAALGQALEVTELELRLPGERDGVARFEALVRLQLRFALK